MYIMYAKILVHVKDHISQFYGNCQTLLESNSPDILAIRQTNLDGSVDTGIFSVIGYLPLIRKDSTTHMHDLAVYVKGKLFLHRTYLGKTLWVLTCVSDWLYFAQHLASFSSNDHFLCFCPWFLILFRLT